MRTTPEAGISRPWEKTRLAIAKAAASSDADRSLCPSKKVHPASGMTNATSHSHPIRTAMDRALAESIECSNATLLSATSPRSFYPTAAGSNLRWTYCRESPSYLGSRASFQERPDSAFCQPETIDELSKADRIPVSSIFGSGYAITPGQRSREKETSAW